MTKPLTKAQRAALEWLTDERRMWNANLRWILTPERSLLGMLTRLSKQNPPLVEFTEGRLFVRITKQGRAALKEDSDAIND